MGTRPLTYFGIAASIMTPLFLWGYALLFERNEIYGNLTFGLCVGALFLDATIIYSQVKNEAITTWLKLLWLAFAFVTLAIFIVLFRRVGAEADVFMFAVMSALTLPAGLLAIIGAAFVPLQSEPTYIALWAVYAVLGWLQSFVLLPRLFGRY